MEFLIKNRCYIKQQDNLEMMKELKSESIDLIYCDILYNTGKKFKDYEDKLGTPQEAMKWYKPRIVEMRRLLKSTGSIYLQCDYRLVHYLKVLMDEVFGRINFKNEIVWNYGLGNNNKKQNWQDKHDTILFYSKSCAYTWNDMRGKVTPQMKAKYCHKDDKGFYMLSYGKKYYLKGGKRIGNVWNDLPNLSPTGNERIGYQTQKPKSLLERIIKASSNKEDVVADFFMGSGTTGEVALELDRKFIGCDIGEKAFNITKERLQRFDIK